MVKMKPRDMECGDCGREYYCWHDVCDKCGRINTIRPKLTKQVSERKEEKFTLNLKECNLPPVPQLDTLNTMMDIVDEWYVKTIDSIIRMKLSQLEQKAFLIGDLNLFHILYNHDFNDVSDVERLVLKLSENGYELSINRPTSVLPRIGEDEPFKVSVRMEEVKMSIKKTIVEV